MNKVFKSIAVFLGLGAVVVTPNLSATVSNVSINNASVDKYGVVSLGKEITLQKDNDAFLSQVCGCAPISQVCGCGGC